MYMYIYNHVYIYDQAATDSEACIYFFKFLL